MPPTALPTLSDELSYGLFWSRNRSPASFLFRGGSGNSGGPFGVIKSCPSPAPLPSHLPTARQQTVHFYTLLLLGTKKADRILYTSMHCKLSTRQHCTLSYSSWKSKCRQNHHILQDNNTACMMCTKRFSTTICITSTFVATILLFTSV